MSRSLRVTDTPYTYIGGESFRVQNASGVYIVTSNIGLCSPPVVQRMISTDFQSKAFTSLNELFMPYSASGSPYMPAANFAFREPSRDSSGNTIIYSPGSGDARGEVIAADVGSGLNIGIIPTFGSGIQNGMSGILDKDDVFDIRSVALRTPIVFAGLGYTTEGLPVPSIYDQCTVDSGALHSVGSGDPYNPSGEAFDRDTRYFCSGFRDRQDLWKAGPVDLRWDEYKRMWVASPEMFIGYALSDVPSASGRFADKSFSSGEMELATRRYDDYTVTGQDRLLFINRSVTTEIQSGVMLIVTRINNGEYIPIWVDCSPDTSGNT